MPVAKEIFLAFHGVAVVENPRHKIAVFFTVPSGHAVFRFAAVHAFVAHIKKLFVEAATVVNVSFGGNIKTCDKRFFAFGIGVIHGMFAQCSAHRKANKWLF